MTILSFHPVKHITTGEGGAILTNNKRFYEKLMTLRTHGITKNNFQQASEGDWYYEMQDLGFNYRITDIQTALGLSQLKKLDRFVRRRRAVAGIYNGAFKNSPFIEVLPENRGVVSSYHIYPIRLKEEFIKARRDVFAEFKNRGLGVQVHYIPIYLQPYYRKLGYKPGSCPRAEKFYRSSITIPLYPAMSDADVRFVIRTVRQVLQDLL
jgi:UDP-4-amino-4,6-dideoxy-L-N-acetyl-beta-L-altrosamine transaminase